MRARPARGGAAHAAAVPGEGPRDRHRTRQTVPPLAGSRAAEHGCSHGSGGSSGAGGAAGPGGARAAGRRDRLPLRGGSGVRRPAEGAGRMTSCRRSAVNLGAAAAAAAGGMWG